MKQNHERIDIIINILKEHFPIECEMVGTSNLSNIANGISKEVRPTGGSNFDISQPLSILIMSFGFVNSVINIYNILKKEGKPITVEVIVNLTNQNNVDNHTKNEVGITNDLTNDMKLNISQDVIDKLSAKPVADHFVNE